MDSANKRKMPEYDLAPERKKFALCSKDYVDPRRQTTLNAWLQKPSPVDLRTKPNLQPSTPVISTSLGNPSQPPSSAVEPSSSSTTPPSFLQEQALKLVDVWIGEDSEFVQIETVSSVGDVVRICAGADNGSIVLSDSTYVATKGMGHEEVELLSQTPEEFGNTSSKELTPLDLDVNFSIESILEAVADSVGYEWPEISAFLQEHPQDTDEAHFAEQFKTFRELEADLSGWDPAHLVKPSGSPNNALHLMLNYPTFKTQKPNDGETADDTNVCTKLLLKKGAPTVRHQATATKFWPPELQDLHASFSMTCEQLPKKVLLLFGASNRQNFEKRHPVQRFNVRISETERVSITTVRNQHSGIRFLAVYCPHPEWLFHNWSEWASRYFDACVNVAAALASVHVKPNYFQHRSQTLVQQLQNDTPSKDAQTALYLEKTNGVLCRPTELPHSVLTFLHDHSITDQVLAVEYEQGRSVVLYAYRLIQKLHPQIKALRREKMDKALVRKRQEWFANLPENAYGDNSRAIVRAAHQDESFPTGQILSRGTMFQNTTNTYFYRPTRSGNTDLPESPEQLMVPSNPIPVDSTTSSEKSSFPTASPKEIPTTSKSKNPLINTAVIRLGQPISLKCIKCSRPPTRVPINSRPEFCTIAHVAGRYIARAQVCETPSCQEGWNKEKGRSGRRMMMIPQDTSIPFVRSDQLNEMHY